MYVKVYSGCLIGIDAHIIEVEIDCGNGIGHITIVGLPGTAIKESQDRVRSSIKACGISLPPGKKWVVNLAPADLAKDGPAYDLPIATGILASIGIIEANNIKNFMIAGELGLDGTIRPIPGVLSLAIACRDNAIKNLVVPRQNANEASYVSDINVYGIEHLNELIGFFNNSNNISPIEKYNRSQFAFDLKNFDEDLDFKYVKGQQFAKRALEIAASGQHNILLVGPPGSGKSMLARRMISIMPPLNFDEACELTKLYSVAQLVNLKGGLKTNRPFRQPHHSSSIAGLVGGGNKPRPGEISLAHMGILFLDELTEFPRHILDNLRQPLETNNITITRANHTLSYPAKFLLVAACNPCPCGYRGDKVQYCSCSDMQSQKYWSKLSGPFLDRIDLHISVPRLDQNELSSDKLAESSQDIAKRVLKAYQIQLDRQSLQDKMIFNSALSGQKLMKYCQIDSRSKDLLGKAVNSLGLSARSFDRILRVSRTIADLDGADKIEFSHIAEALSYRSLARLN